MLNEKFTNETAYRRFLLGEMTEKEREKFESEFLAEADIFDEICVAEDELVESYIRGTLDFETKRQFETHYLKSANGVKKLEITRSMLEKLKTSTEIKEEKISFFKSLNAFFTNLKLAFGAGFALLLIALTGWFLLKKPSETEIVKTVTPTPTVRSETNLNLQTNQNSVVEIPANNTNNSIKENANLLETKPTPKPTATPKNEKIAVNPVLALFAGTVRGEGKIKEIKLSNNSNALSLNLNLESQDYKIYRAEVVDQDGNAVFKSGNILARRSKLSTFIPTSKLKTGDYLVKVYGIDAENEEESAADFQFRVKR